MKTFWKSLWRFLRRRGPASGQSPQQRLRVSPYRPNVEVIEDRTAPAVLGFEMLALPTPQDFGLPPLVAAPVSVGSQSPALTNFLGGPLDFSMFVTLPPFLRPAGTNDIAAPIVGPMTITGFQVDNEQLTQMSGNILLPNGRSFGFTAPMRTELIATTPERDFVQMNIEKLRLESNGARVVVRNIDLTASFERSPGSRFLPDQEGSSPLTILSQGLTRAAQEVGAAIDRVELPPPLDAALASLTPAVARTFHLAHLQLDGLNVEDQSIDLSLAGGITIDLFADTGVGKLLGNLLAEAMRLRDMGLTSWQALVAHFLNRFLAPPSPGSPGRFPFNIPDFASFLSAIGDSTSDTASGPQGLSFWDLLSQATWLPFVLVSAGGAGGAEGSELVNPLNVVPEFKPAEEPLPQVLPQVLPDVGLPANQTPPVQPPVDDEANSAHDPVLMTEPWVYDEVSAYVDEAWNEGPPDEAATVDQASSEAESVEYAPRRQVAALTLCSSVGILHVLEKRQAARGFRKDYYTAPRRELLLG